MKFTIGFIKRIRILSTEIHAAKRVKIKTIQYSVNVMVFMFVDVLYRKSFNVHQIGGILCIRYTANALDAT